MPKETMIEIIDAWKTEPGLVSYAGEQPAQYIKKIEHPENAQWVKITTDNEQTTDSIFQTANAYIRQLALFPQFKLAVDIQKSDKTITFSAKPSPFAINAHFQSQMSWIISFVDKLVPLDKLMTLDLFYLTNFHLMTPEERNAGVKLRQLTNKFGPCFDIRDPENGLSEEQKRKLAAHPLWKHTFNHLPDSAKHLYNINKEGVLEPTQKPIRYTTPAGNCGTQHMTQNPNPALRLFY